MSFLQQAHLLGAAHAQEAFKVAADKGDVLTSILGGVPGAGPSLAGYASEKTLPPHEDVFARTSAGTGLGQTVGGLGGTALGAGIGAGGAALYNKFRDKGLLESIFGGGDVDPLQAALTGGGIGGTVGTVAGGAYGAHKGREQAKNVASGEQLEDLLEQRQQMHADYMRRRQRLVDLLRAHSVGQSGAPMEIDVQHPALIQQLQQYAGGQR